jgi:hypothetical protein
VGDTIAGSRAHRAQHQHGGTHLSDHVIGGDCRGDIAGLKRHAPAELAVADSGDARGHAELVEKMSEAVDIGEAREVREGQRLVGQESARK